MPRTPNIRTSKYRIPLNTDLKIGHYKGTGNSLIPEGVGQHIFVAAGLSRHLALPFAVLSFRFVMSVRRHFCVLSFRPERKEGSRQRFCQKRSRRGVALWRDFFTEERRREGPDR
jgi:hypothetical protein